MLGYGGQSGSGTGVSVIISVSCCIIQQVLHACSCRIDTIIFVTESVIK